MARKRETQEIDRICGEEGLSRGQRELLHREITRQHYTLDEIRAIAREIKQLYPGK